MVVFVDHNGRPLSTATDVVVLLPPTAASVQAIGTNAATQTPSFSGGMTTTSHGQGNHEPQGSQRSTPSPNRPSTPFPTTSNASGSPAGSLSQPTGVGGPDLGAAALGLTGVTYSPYNADGTCKSGSRVLADFRKIGSQYGLVRIYGVDCNQVATVVSAARSIGVKLFLGIFSLDGLNEQIQLLVDAVYAHGDWSMVEGVSVGNELVNNGQASAQQVINAVTATRQSLRSVGFHGPVVTVDTFVAVLRNPLLCAYSDFCAMNIHPFFDPNTPAAAAGSFVSNKVAAVRNVLLSYNQRIVVTETGWP